MANTAAQEYLKALEKQRKNQDRSTGSRKTDAQVAKDQAALAAKMTMRQDAGTRRKAASSSGTKTPSRATTARDAPAYRGNKAAPASSKYVRDVIAGRDSLVPKPKPKTASSKYVQDVIAGRDSLIPKRNNK